MTEQCSSSQGDMEFMASDINISGVHGIPCLISDIVRKLPDPTMSNRGHYVFSIATEVTS